MVSLWQFSLDLHARPGADADLIALQDGAGVDVPGLLFCIYAGLISLARLDGAVLAAAIEMAGAAGADKIVPLRIMRRRLKAQAASDPRIGEIRDRVKSAELDAERELIDRLGALLSPAGKGASVTARGNVEAYVRKASLTLKASDWQAVDRLIASALAVCAARP